MIHPHKHRSDTEEFEILQHSMDHLTIDSSTQKQIFQILAGILHLGNINFVPSRETEGESEIGNGIDSQRVSFIKFLFGIKFFIGCHSTRSGS